MKKILIAIPTARYIEPDTFKSIYDLKIPEGYTVDFQYFYGYRVDQVRNLIADWVVRGYDYLFSVDHDVTFASDTLEKLISHNKDMVAGVYRQRLPEQMIEIYDTNHQRMKIEHLNSLTQIGACGFGCVLVKKEVFAKVGYPQFEYHHALDHNNTISEDTDFCRKATNAGFSIFCDPSILCGHIGSTTMHVQVPQNNPVQERLRDLSLRDDQPRAHVEYLKQMKVKPKVIYDIGACVMHWTKEAKKIWPGAEIIMFDAMDHAEFLYKESGHRYFCGGPLGDEPYKQVAFYENAMDPAGNSIYKENTEHFTEEHKVKKYMYTLDQVAMSYQYPWPDPVKIDVQGAELDVLKGALIALSQCKDIIIEMQHMQYNLGAPHESVVTEYLESIGFEKVAMIHSGHVDADYHFTRKA